MFGHTFCMDWQLNININMNNISTPSPFSTFITHDHSKCPQQVPPCPNLFLTAAPQISPLHCSKKKWFQLFWFQWGTDVRSGICQQCCITTYTSSRGFICLSMGWVPFITWKVCNPSMCRILWITRRISWWWMSCFQIAHEDLSSSECQRTRASSPFLAAHAGALVQHNRWVQV